MFYLSSQNEALGSNKSRGPDPKLNTRLTVEKSSKIQCMQKGYNSDIQVRGKTYHVQTEDWGQQNPFLVTRVFSNGAVLKTIKTTYADVLRGGPIDDQNALRLALRQQHSRILDQLVSGQLEHRV